jgi:hypothetical protein
LQARRDSQLRYSAQITADEEKSRAVRDKCDHDDYLECSLQHTSRSIPNAQAARRNGECETYEETKYGFGGDERDVKQRAFSSNRAVALSNLEQIEINRCIKRTPSTQPKIVNPTEHLEIKAMQTKEFVIGSHITPSQRRFVV